MPGYFSSLVSVFLLSLVDQSVGDGGLHHAAYRHMKMKTMHIYMYVVTLISTEMAVDYIQHL